MPMTPSLSPKAAGIFNRSAKSIDLTPEIRKLLGIEDKSLPPIS